MPVSFPSLRPTQRAYKPGKYPQTVFESINGSTSVVQFGSVAYNSELTLRFDNIEDSIANQIISTYESSNGQWDYVVFSSGVMDCVSSQMRSRMQEGLLKWRFAGPPTVSYKFRDRCDVSCSFIGYLDGA